MVSIIPLIIGSTPTFFSTRQDGESFAKLSAAILDKGPTVIVVWEENGNIFGGFASHSWSVAALIEGGSCGGGGTSGEELDHCSKGSRFQSNWELGALISFYLKNQFENLTLC